MSEKPSTDDPGAVATRDELLDGLARELHAAVAEYHDRDVVNFDGLPDDEKRDWYRAAERTFEAAVDCIIGAGRPVWWTS